MNKRRLHLAIIAPKSPEGKKLLAELEKGLKTLDVDFSVIPDANSFGDVNAALLLEHNENILNEIRRKHCVPIAPMNGNRAIDYNPVEESGDGFYFKDATAWDVFAATVRAAETFKFPYDWENLLRALENAQ